jgi:hypothetical protein
LAELTEFFRIKTVKPHIFDKLLQQKISYSEVCTETGLTQNEEENRKIYWLMNWVRFSLLSDKEFSELPDEDRVTKFGESLWSYNVERDRLIPIFSQKLSMFVVK